MSHGFVRFFVVVYFQFSVFFLSSAYNAVFNWNLARLNAISALPQGSLQLTLSQTLFGAVTYAVSAAAAGGVVIHFSIFRCWYLLPLLWACVFRRPLNQLPQRWFSLVLARTSYSTEPNPL